MNNLFLAIILTLFPFIELRGGLPVALIHAQKLNIETFPIFLLIIILNILLIFLVFAFLDFFHKRLLNFKPYHKLFHKYLEKTQKKVDKFEKRYVSLGMLALILFVAIPLPVTGAYSASLISWLLDLNRKKSIIAISIGIILAGLIIYAATLGLLFVF